MHNRIMETLHISTCHGCSIVSSPVQSMNTAGRAPIVPIPAPKNPIDTPINAKNNAPITTNAIKPKKARATKKHTLRIIPNILIIFLEAEGICGAISLKPS